MSGSARACQSMPCAAVLGQSGRPFVSRRPSSLTVGGKGQTNKHAAAPLPRFSSQTGSTNPKQPSLAQPHLLAVLFLSLDLPVCSPQEEYLNSAQYAPPGQSKHCILNTNSLFHQRPHGINMMGFSTWFVSAIVATVSFRVSTAPLSRSPLPDEALAPREIAQSSLTRCLSTGGRCCGTDFFGPYRSP